jgi:hypothetical protein
MEKATLRSESLLWHSLARNKVLSRTALALAVGGTLLFNTGCSEEQDSPHTPAPSELPTPTTVVEATTTGTPEDLQLICPPTYDTFLGDGYPGIAAEYFPGQDVEDIMPLIDNISAREEGRSKSNPEYNDTLLIFETDCE